MQPAIFLVEVDVGGFERQTAALRHRIARVDREVDQDLLGLTAVEPDRRQVRRRGQFEVDVLADQSRQQPLHVREDVVQVDDLRTDDLLAARRRAAAASGWRRESAALSTLIRYSYSGSIGCMSIKASDMLPLMAVSRLLKSCATPPASRPIDSIFCDWMNCASIRFRSVTSRQLTTTAAMAGSAR